jgi:integrase/recombinase XerD
VSSGWLPANPAKGIKPPKARPKPTLPFSDHEWEKIIWALDSYGEIHPQSPVLVRKQLKALVLVMRHSGIRISETVDLRQDSIDADGRLFLYQAKTGSPVCVPLSPVVIEALKEADSGNPYYFWSNVGTVTTALTHWQSRLKKIFNIAGIPDAHSHRFRDTFSVDLLSKVVSPETVSQLLGHTSIKTTQKLFRQCLTLPEITDLGLPQTVVALKAHSIRPEPGFDGGAYIHLHQAVSVAGAAIAAINIRF